MKKPLTSRIITGLIIIFVGVALLLSNLNITAFNSIIHEWWPLTIVAGGIVLLINNTKNYIWSLLIVSLGVILQLNQLGLTHINPWQLFWPIIIIAVGISILINRAAASKTISKADRQDISAILSGSEQKNHSQDFKGSKITAIMGGAQIDLRKATIKKEATLEILSIWGGVEIIVPETVVVKNQLSHIMGGSEDKTVAPKESTAPVLNIIGDIIMAGVEIKN